MDINRLNEFITLATHLNYSKAANQLYLTQPALSRHIHDLEQTIGAKLFVRDTHNVYLTSVGKLFFQEAREIIARYEHALEAIRELSASTTGEVRLGFLGAAVQPFLAKFYHMFTEKASPDPVKPLCGRFRRPDLPVKQRRAGLRLRKPCQPQLLLRTGQRNPAL